MGLLVLVLLAMMFCDTWTGRLVFVVLCLWVCACTPPRSPEYPRHDCRTGGEFTYHSDGSWDATVRGDCGKAWD